MPASPLLQFMPLRACAVRGRLSSRRRTSGTNCVSLPAQVRGQIQSRPGLPDRRMHLPEHLQRMRPEPADKSAFQMRDQ